MANILIVDDSAFLRVSIRMCIERETDWIVCGEAENGKIALEKVLELGPDLVILDLAMPVMNGLDAARKIRKIAPNLPILLFTLHVSGDLQRQAQLIGIQGVVSKAEGGTHELLSSMHGLLDTAGIH